MAWWKPAVAVGLLTGAAGLGAPAAAEPPSVSLATEVEAVYLLKLPPFVDWPASAMTGPRFIICIVGPDPFGQLMEQASAGFVLKGKPVVVRRMASLDLSKGCEMMFLAGSASAVRDELAQLRGHPVLSVTDGAKIPGIVDFVMSEGRVRFRIDNEAAAAAGLNISSKLLDLATSVNGRRGG